MLTVSRALFFNQLREDAEELRKLLAEATRPRVKDALTIALKKIETDIIKKWVLF